MRLRYAYLNRWLRLVAAFVDAAGYALFAFRKVEQIHPEAVRKVLVVRPDSIGDNFLMTGFISLLPRVFPEAAIDVMCGSWCKAIWEGHPAVNSILVFDNPHTAQPTRAIQLGPVREIIREIRTRGYDLFIDARGDPLTALVGYCASVPIRIGYRGHEVLSFLYTHTAQFVRAQHELDKYENFLKLAGVDTVPGPPGIYPSEQEKAHVQTILRRNFESRQVVALHLTAGATYKIWPVNNFAALIEKIHAACPPLDFAVVGAAADLPFVEELRKRVECRLTSLAGELTLRETYEFLAHCALFIGSDSAPVHFAASLGRPTVNLVNFASGGVSRCKAIGKQVYSLEGHDPTHDCRPRKCRYPCPHMTSISVERVLEITEPIIKSL